MAAIRGRTVIALLTLLPVLGMVAPVAAASRPNIVFILTDDQRWDTIDKKHSVDGRTPVMAKVQSLLVKIPTFAQVRGLFTKPGGTPHIWKYVQLVSGEKELYNLDRDPFELSNVAGNASNAALVATMAARLRELDPGWTGSAPAAAAPTAFPPDYANDDAFE